MNREINLDGVAIVNDTLTLLTIVERADGTRDHSVEHGAAGIVDVSIFPQSYKEARYIHLATFEPHRQLQWITFLKQTMPDAKLSADTLEQDIQYAPEIVEKVLSSVDLIFINEGELALLKRSRSQMAFDIPMIVKKGAGGAEYIHGEININVPAPNIEVVDTTGAGEVLAATFVLLRDKSEDIKIALTEGVHLASRVVTSMRVAHIAPLKT